MDSTHSKFEADLRISVKPVILFLLFIGIAIFTVSFYEENLLRTIAVACFGMGLVIWAVSLWGLDGTEALLGRWLLVLTFVGVILIGVGGFGVRSAIFMVFVPVGIAAAAIDGRASIGIAVLQTLLMVGLGRLNPDIPMEGILFGLAANWVMAGFMLVVYHPVHAIGQWSWDYFKSAQNLLEETRRHRIELEQANQDLYGANKQLIRLNKLAQNLRQEAEELRSAKEQFVANVSHELRTPLNMIIGYIEMILQKPNLYGKKIPNGLMADLVVIERNAAHLSDLINDILDFSQVEAGQMALSKEQVNFQDILEFTVAAVQPLFKAKGLYLEKYVPENLPDIYCDPLRLREVMLNLLSNAGRFTDNGGVQVRVWEEGPNMHVSVADTGPGITEDGMRRLFVPFEQLDNGIRKKSGGTGLGLAISKQFIEMHNGKIWVESQKGVGSTFTFRIPLRIDVPMASHAARWFNRYAPYEQRARLLQLPETRDRGSFVVVESENALCRILSRYMNETEFVAAADLKEAAQEAKARTAGALLMNNPKLPNLFAGIEDIHSLEAGSPLIAFSLPGLKNSREKLHVADVLLKPISRTQLLDSLQSIGVLGGTILIADDDPDALQLFGRILTTADPPYRVRLARDGQEVLDLLGQFTPDAILLDMVMPGISGYQLLKERDVRQELAGIPIVVISAQDDAVNPLVSEYIVVTQKNGFSVRQLLACINVLSQTLSSGFRAGVSERPADPAG